MNNFLSEEENQENINTNSSMEQSQHEMLTDARKKAESERVEAVDGKDGELLDIHNPEADFFKTLGGRAPDSAFAVGGKREIGFGEKLRKGMEAETGEEYSTVGAVASRLTPFAAKTQKIGSNYRVNALSAIYEGIAFDDINAVPKSVIAQNGFEGLNSAEEVKERRLERYKNVLGEDAQYVMQSPKYKSLSADDKLKVLRPFAEEELRKIAEVKQSAQKTLSNTTQGTLSKIGTGAIENTGYTLEYVVGSILGGGPVGGFLLAGSAAAGERASSLSTNDYEIDAMGGLVNKGNAYSEEDAFLKGVVGGFTEAGVESALGWGLGKIGGAVLKGIGKVPGAGNYLIEPTKSLINATKGAINKVPGAQMLAKLGRGYNSLSRITSQQEMPMELLEENVQSFFDDVVGLAAKKGENESFGKEWENYKRDTLNWDTQRDILLGMVGTMVLQGAGGAYIDKKRRAPGERRVAEAAKGMAVDYSPNEARGRLELLGFGDELNSLSDSQAVFLANLSHTMEKFTPEELLEILSRQDARVRNMADEIRKKYSWEYDQQLAENGESAEFTPDNNSDGLVNTLPGEYTDDYGDKHEARVILDTAHGVGIRDNMTDEGDAFTVKDNRGNEIGVSSMQSALIAANMLVKQNAVKNAENKQKAEYISQIIAQNYGTDAQNKFQLRNTWTELIDEMRASGKSEYAIERFRLEQIKRTPAFRLDDGRVFVILDNVNSPMEAAEVLQHEVIGHDSVINKFGGKEGVLEFLRSLDSKTMRDYTAAAVNEKKMKLLAFHKYRGEEITPELEAQVEQEAMEWATTDEGIQELFARLVERRRHNPAIWQKLAHRMRQRARDKGVNKPINDNDLEVILSQMEKESGKVSFTGQISVVPSMSVGGMTFLRFEDNTAPETDADVEGVEDGDNAITDDDYNSMVSAVSNLMTARDGATPSQSKVSEAVGQILGAESWDEAAQILTSLGNVDEATYNLFKRAFGAEGGASETGNGAAQAQAQSEQAQGVTPPTGEKAGFVEAGKVPSEVGGKVNTKGEIEKLYKKDSSRSVRGDRISDVAARNWSDLDAMGVGESITTADGRKFTKTAAKGETDAVWKGEDDKSIKQLALAETAGDLAEVRAKEEAARKEKEERVQKRNKALKEANKLRAGLYQRFINEWQLNPNSIFAYWHSMGGKLFEMPETDKKGRFINDPAADTLNNFFDGLKGAQREMWKNRIFGYERNGSISRGNDVVSEEVARHTNNEELVNNYDEILDTFLNEYEEFLKWKQSGAVSREEQEAADRAEAEEAAEREYYLGELAAREEADAEYNNAFGEVEKYDNGHPFIKMFSAKELSKLQEGDTIRFDHADIEWVVVSYDKKRGILTVKEPNWVAEERAFSEGTDLMPPKEMRYVITKNGISEYKEEEKPNEPEDKRRTSKDVNGDEQGKRGEDSRAEGKADKGNEVAVADKKPAETAKTEQKVPKKDLSTASESSIKMKDAAAEKRAKEAESALAALFSDPDYAIMGANEEEYTSYNGPQRVVEESDLPFTSFLASHNIVGLDRENGTLIESGVLRDAFEAFETRETQRKLFSKVFDVAEKLGCTYKVDYSNRSDSEDKLDKEELAYELGGRIVFHVDRLDRENNETIANTILHELIHGVTSYAIDISENQAGVEGVALPTSLHNAVRKLRATYKLSKPFVKGTYEASNIHEFVAGLADPAFRRKLDQKNLLRRALDAIVDIFRALFGHPTTTKEAVNSNRALKALHEFLENFDRTAFETHRNVADEDASRANYAIDQDKRELFQKRAGAVMEIIEVYRDSGVAEFKTLATRMFEGYPDKFANMKPHLRGIWNYIAEQEGLDEVSKDETNRIYSALENINYDTISSNKEVENEKRVDSDSGTGSGRDNVDRSDEGISPVGSEAVSGLPSGGRVRGSDSDERVDGIESGRIPGLLQESSDSESQKEQSSRNGETAGEHEPVGNRVGHEVGESLPGRDSAKDGADGSSRPSGRRSGRGRVTQSIKNAANEAANDAPGSADFVMTESVEEAILERSPIKRVHNNVAALKLLQELKSRDYKATPEEQKTLAKYVGWGGLSEIFTTNYDRVWQAEKRVAEGGHPYIDIDAVLNSTKYGKEGYEAYKEIRSILNDEEFASAKATVLTAFYTPIPMVRAEHDALRKLGVLGGRVLGPSAGVGNYASAAGIYPKGLSWQFVEKDEVSGLILRALFPNQRVHIGGFQETKFPDGFYDLAIDNVPYADIDILDKSIGKKSFKIHDYFFAKTLSKLRPGGIMMFLTSTGTLDKIDGKLRQFLSQNGGKIIGAVRLPNGFFSKNAGTDVASDLVVIQRQSGIVDNSGFMNQVKYGEEGYGKNKTDLTYNEYFKEHPEQVIGEMKASTGQYGRPVIDYKMPEGDLYEMVSAAIDRALEGVDKELLLKNTSKAVRKEHAPIYDDEGLRQGNITIKDGKVYEKNGEELIAVEMPRLKEAQKKALMKKYLTPMLVVEKVLAIRKAMRDVVDAEVYGVDDDTLAPRLAKLNELYDDFVKKVGTFHDKNIAPFVMLDKADGNRIMSLEKSEKVDGKTVIEKADIFKKRVIYVNQRPTKADSTDDALIISYGETGAIDIERIAGLLGLSEADAIERMKSEGKIFENPQTGLFEPYWEYLSGHVRRKLSAAKAAAESDKSFARNVEELEKVQPADISLDVVDIKFGAPWVDADAMVDFLYESYGLGRYSTVKVNRNEITGKWNVELPRTDVQPFGATAFSQEKFLNSVLNAKSLDVTVKDPVDGKHYKDERKSEAQKLAAEKLHAAFARFVRTNEKWFAPSGEAFNLAMNDNVPMVLPKNILPLRESGMNEDFIKKLHAEGREYQPAVIARGVFGGKSLCLAHCVGAGKTLEMQTIGMVGRHLGMFNKSMYVVPNHMLDQFCNEFLAAFPNANLLKMSSEDVKPQNRRAFFAKASNGDWDAIVVKHSTFSMKLPLTPELQKQYLQQEIRRLTEAKLAAKGEKGTVKDIEKLIAKSEDKIKKLDNSESKDDNIVPFEELGVDQLFVDEAHNFKGLPVVSTQARNTKGLQQGDSQRALDMEMKATYIQSLHGGKRGVVFATGTPLSNAPVVEAYVMLRYLAPYALEEQNIKNFDDFVSTFGRIETESEFDPSGKTTKEVQRVSAFVNIPEMMRLFKSVVDIVNSDQIKVKRPKMKLEAVPVPMSAMQEKVMEMVSKESAIPPTKEEKSKYLTLTSIAKRACTDPHLVGIDEDGYKLVTCARKIKEVYDETSDVRGAQLVFCDMFNTSDAEGTEKYIATLGDVKKGKKSWNLYKSLKDKLVAQGIPANEIGIINDIDKAKGGEEGKDAAKEEMFEKVRSGEIRILLGSRLRMGEGTNVQERLAAIHLLHPGWKPAEDTQAIGRIIRPGNMFETGKVFYYITQGNKNIGSYETKNHELVGIKSRLIEAIMHGDETIREMGLDESAVERDMLMGLATANKDLIKLIDVRRVLRKAELNAESVLFSARSNSDKAERAENQLEKMREEYADMEEGAKVWRQSNPNGSFVLTTADGRTLDTMKDMSGYVSAQVIKQLAKDRYDRDERLEIGSFGGVPLILTTNFADNKIHLAVPSVGYAREIAYSGFLPDFTISAMTAFKGAILNRTSADIEESHKLAIEDVEKRIAKLKADAKSFADEWESEKERLKSLRSERMMLERKVTPLIVEATNDRRYVSYGNWWIEKDIVSLTDNYDYTAVRETDGKRLTAPTVKDLLPLIDAEDFELPSNAATKTAALLPNLRTNRNGEKPAVDTMTVEEVNFADPDFALGRSVIPKEYREVYNRYHNADGTAKAGYRKAPNGKKSNLTEMQWNMVRTPAFKKWFGDWEDLLRRNSLDATKAVAVKAGAFIRQDGNTVQQTAKALFSIAREYSTEVGKVTIDARSAHTSLSHGYSQKKLDALVSIQDDFNNAVYIGSEPDFNGKDIINHYFAYPIEYGERKERNYVFCRAREDKNLNRLYLHEVLLESDIKNKGDAFQTAAASSLKDASHTNASPVKKPKGAFTPNIILQRLFAVNPDSVSKVVDENGEPLVVWHGTPNGEFWQFDREKIGSTTDRQDVRVGRLGFYFTNDRGSAESYAEYKGSDSKPKVMPVYLNMRNPLVVEDSGWGSAADQADARKNDLDRWAKAGGHDGIIVKASDIELVDGGKDSVYIVFSPTQIKSATDNTGAFDGGNPDIRFADPDYKIGGDDTKLRNLTQYDIFTRRGDEDAKEYIERIKSTYPTAARLAGGNRQLFAILGYSPDGRQFAGFQDTSSRNAAIYRQTGRYGASRGARANDPSRSSKVYERGGLEGSLRGDGFIRTENGVIKRNYTTTDFYYPITSGDEIDEVLIRRLFLNLELFGEELGVKRIKGFTRGADGDIYVIVESGMINSKVNPSVRSYFESRGYSYGNMSSGYDGNGPAYYTRNGYEVGGENLKFVQNFKTKAIVPVFADIDDRGNVKKYNDSLKRRPLQGSLFADPDYKIDGNGITNADQDNAQIERGLKAPKKRYRGDEAVMRGAEEIRSNAEFTDKVARAVKKNPRAILAEENIALAQEWLKAKDEYDDVVHSIAEAVNAGDNAAVRKMNVRKKELEGRMTTIIEARQKGVGEAARTLRTNRFLFKSDYSLAGLVAQATADLGRPLTDIEYKEWKDIADELAKLDKQERDMLIARIKAYADKEIKDIIAQDKVDSIGKPRTTNEMRRMLRKRNDALAQIEVIAFELGGEINALIPTGEDEDFESAKFLNLRKYLRNLAQYHVYHNPNITEQELIAALIEDIAPYFTVDADTVRQIFSGYGHSWNVDRTEIQRKVSDLSTQSRVLLQIADYKAGELAKLTGPQRSEPSEEARELMKIRDQIRRKMEREGKFNDQGKHLKTLLDSAKTRYANMINDIKTALEAGTQLQKREPLGVTDEELETLKAEYAKLKEEYDAIWGSGSKMTDEQKRQMVEKGLKRALERWVDKLERAQRGDFSSDPKAPKVTSADIEALRKKIEDHSKEWRKLKAARSIEEWSDEELLAYAQRRLEAVNRALKHWQTVAITGDISPKKKRDVPFPNEEMRKEYERIQEQRKRAYRQILDMREHLKNKEMPLGIGYVKEYAKFVFTFWRTFWGSIDVSAMGRQTAPMTLAHPSRAVKTLFKTFGAMMSSSKAMEIDEELRNNPWIREALNNGWLEWRNLEGDGGPNDVDMFHGVDTNAITIGKKDGKEWRVTLGDIPYLGAALHASERQYATFINMFSADIYIKLCNSPIYGKNGPTDAQKQMIAAAINMANGSAQLGAKGKEIAAMLTDLFFWSTKLGVSRAQVAVGGHILYPFLSGKKGDATMKKRGIVSAQMAIETIKAWVAATAAGWLMLSLFGDDDEKKYVEQAKGLSKLLMVMRPRIGSTKLDFTGGVAQWWQLMQMAVTGVKETSTGKKIDLANTYGRSKSGELGRFLQGKLNPFWSNLIALWEEKDFVGNEFGWGELLKNSTTPLAWRDIWDAATNDNNGLGRGLLMAPFILVGAGGSTYDVDRSKGASNKSQKSDYDVARAEVNKNRDKKVSTITEHLAKRRVEKLFERAHDTEQIIKRREKKGLQVPQSLRDRFERQKAEALEAFRSSR